MAIALILAGAGAASASAARVPANLQGTWIADNPSGKHSRTVFARLTIRIGSGNVNSPIGTLRFSAAGGRTTCRARLTYLGPLPFNHQFGVKFLPGAPRRARGFCKPSRSNGKRFIVSLRGSDEIVFSIRGQSGGYDYLDAIARLAD